MEKKRKKEKKPPRLFPVLTSQEGTQNRCEKAGKTSEKGF